MDANEIKYFIESALLAAGRPLSVDQLQKLFDGRTAPEKPEIRPRQAESSSACGRAARDASPQPNRD